MEKFIDEDPKEHLGNKGVQEDELQEADDLDKIMEEFINEVLKNMWAMKVCRRMKYKKLIM